MPPTKTSNPGQTPNQQGPNQGLTPQVLANQLFDAAVSQALAQNMTDPREAGRWVARFLADALYYAITSTKDDPVVFLTETLIYVASSSCGGDEAARKELLKHIGDTIANAPPIPKPGAGGPPPAGKP
jgi:hypothetical protein